MSWSRLDRRLHWLMAALFLWQFASRWTASALPEGHAALFHLHGLHSLGGYAIFGLGVWRILHRIRMGRPPLLAATRLEAVAARSVHANLYLMMFAQPVSGILAAGDPGGPTASLFRTLHQIGSWIILALVLLHVSAAVWHHVGKKDDTLSRMLK